MDRGPGVLQSLESDRIRHDWATNIHTHTHTHTHIYIYIYIISSISKSVLLEGHSENWKISQNLCKILANYISDEMTSSQNTWREITTP